MASSSCAPEAGRGAFVVEWPELDPPPSPIVFIRSRVELGSGGSVQGRPVGPIAYGDAVRFEVDEIPNGAGHVIFLEVTATRDASVVLLYATSEPFELQAGRLLDTVVLGLQLPQPIGGELGVRIGDGAERIPSPGVVLELTTTTATSVELSNRASFDQSRRIDLAKQEGASERCPPPPGVTPEEPCRFRVPWDLNAGLDDPCEREDDCPRQVFAQFRDAAGFVSRNASARTTLDTRPPELIGPAGYNPPPPLAAGARTILELRFQEPIPSDGLTLEWDDPSVQLSRLAPPEGSDERSSSFTFTLTSTGSTWPDTLPQTPAVPFVFRGRAIDGAGNDSGLLDIAGPPIDAVLPSVGSPELEPDTWAVDASPETQLQFQVSEPVERVLLQIEGNEVDTSCDEENAPDGEAFRWACTLDGSGLAPSALELSTKNGDAVLIDIEVFDEAGNRGRGQTALLADYVAPRVTEPVNVDFIPPNEVPVIAAAAAKDRAIIQVRVLFDEPIRNAPTLRAIHETEGSTLAFELLTASEEGGEAVWSATVDADRHPSGRYVPIIEVADVLGNARTTTFSAPQIEVDLSSGALDLDQDALSYLRSPVGRADAEPLMDPVSGRVVFTLPSGPARFALAPADPYEAVDALPSTIASFTGGDRPLLLRFWADADKRTFLGLARPRADGSWARDELTLVNFDTPRLYVSGFDRAGNESEPVLVENVWYIAATGPAETGDVTPHRVLASRTPQPPLGDQLEPVSTSSRADLGSPSGRGVVAEADYRWRRRWADESLGALEHLRAGLARSVYDGARGVGLRFSEAFARPVLAYDGRGFGELGEGISFVQNGTYDPRRARLVMVGGNARDGRTLELVDGERWVDVTPPGPAPTGCFFCGMTYDSRRSRMVLFGAGTNRDETWTYDGERWTELTSTATVGRPPGRYYPRMAYDRARDRVVLVGGQRQFVTFGPQDYFGDVWELDGSTWTRAQGSSGFVDAPVSNAGHQVFWDGGHGEVACAYVEDDGAGTFSLRIASWNGATWTTRAPPLPDRLFFLPFTPAVYYDAGRARTVVFSGTGGSRAWELVNGQWVSVAFQSPSPRNAAGAAVDPRSDDVLVFGGANSGANGAVTDRVDEMWAWNGQTWTPIPTSTASWPPAQTAWHRMVSDSDRNRVVLATDPTSVWEWDGRAWATLTPTSTIAPPPTRFGAAFTYDPLRRRTWRLGWDEDGDPHLYGWTGARWDRAPPPTSVPELVTPMWRFEPASGVSALFAGFIFVRDAMANPNPPILYDHTWDGVAWRPSQLTFTGFGGTLEVAPDPRNGRLIAYDREGRTWRRRPNRTWEEIARGPSRPPRRQEAVFEAHPDRGELVLFGGQDPVDRTLLNDTWLLEPPTRSAVQFESQLPSELRRRDVLDIRVRASCGGQYRSGGRDLTGADLFGYELDAYVPLAANAAGLPSVTGSTAELRFQPLGTRSATVARDLIGPENRVYIQCRPAEVSDPGFASAVEMDYAEVRVKYRNTP